MFDGTPNLDDRSEADHATSRPTALWIATMACAYSAFAVGVVIGLCNMLPTLAATAEIAPIGPP